MGIRTSPGAVKELLGKSYDPSLSTNPGIATANSIVDDLISACGVEGVTVPTAKKLELIERWLAAHYYTQTDPLYMSRSTGKSSGAFVVQDFKKAAIDLDPTGLLASVISGETAGMAWLGKAPSEQVAYEDRD